MEISKISFGGQSNTKKRDYTKEEVISFMKSQVQDSFLRERLMKEINKMNSGSYHHFMNNFQNYLRKAMGSIG